MELLGSHKQALWSCLRLSVCQRVDYWLQLCRPSDIHPVATWLDKQLWQVLQQTVGFTIPRVGGGSDWDIVLQVPGREGKTYQEWVVRQPIKSGGLGMRCLVEISPAAYFGALESAIPSFTWEDMICPQLEAVVGGEESWGMDAVSETRWEKFEQSGCIDSLEMRAAVDFLQEKFRQNSMFLGERVGGSAV